MAIDYNSPCSFAETQYLNYILKGLSMEKDVTSIVVNFFGFGGYPCSQKIDVQHLDSVILGIRQNSNFQNVIDIIDNNNDVIYENFENKKFYEDVFVNNSLDKE